MNAEQFQRAERLFHEALAQSAVTREAFLHAQANGDTELAACVADMIEHFERDPTATMVVNRSMASSLARDEADQALINTTVGRFQIVELLGRGGFGNVYRAEQREPIRREVALKIMHSGSHSERVIARFEAERQALALMQHPNIAQVFDAGRTEAEFGARPYFAMELVGGGAGEQITTYCNKCGLTIEQRLALFIDVCEGVLHAHQKGVIHRDLKPSNILVSEVNGKATPKIIDFGIAKAILQPLTDQAFTEARQILGTPQYMSPEQADTDGQNIDTRSDIYSLGVVLYELLTGTTPLDARALRGASYADMQAMIRDTAAEKPSTRVFRSQRSEDRDQKSEASEPGRTSDIRPPTSSLPARRLRGDLDWITLKALEHDRDRRYSSASAIADDVRRHLNHEPVLAGPPTVAYRVRKFVRRNRVGVAAAALAALAVIAGVIGTAVGMLRVRESAARALSINQFMSEVLHSASPDKDGADVRLGDVLRNASATASERFANQPDLEAQVRSLLSSVFLRLDIEKESINEADAAATLLESIHGRDDPRALEARLTHVQTLVHAERVQEAEHVLGYLGPRIAKVASESDLSALKIAMFRASIHRLRGRYAEAETILRDLRGRLGSLEADERMRIGVLDNLLGVMLAQQDGQAPDHLQDCREIETLALELGDCADRHSDSITAVRARVIMAKMMAERGALAEAAELCREVLATSESRLGTCHGLRRLATGVLAATLNRLGDSAGAAEVALQHLDSCKAGDDTPMELLVQLVQTLPYAERSGRWAEGESLAREYRGLLEQMSGGHGDMRLFADLYIARFVSLQGRFDDSRPMLEALLAREHETDDDQTRARLHMCWGSDQARRGLYEQAEQSLLTAAALLDDIRAGTQRKSPDDLIGEFINLYQAWGKPEKAAEYQRLREEALAAQRIVTPQEAASGR